MIRTLAAAAVLASATLLAPMAAHAADDSAYYAATPVAAPTKTVLITSGTLWKWNNTAFTAAKGPQRDVIVRSHIEFQNLPPVYDQDRAGLPDGG